MGFSCWGPSLPWLLQPQSLSPLLLLSPTLMLIPGTATDTVATDGAATTDLMDTMATTERGQQTPSQRPLLPLTLTLILMLGTATMATDTVDGYGGYYRPYGYYGYYGKRSAEPEPTAAAEPKANADPWYGYGYRGYG